MARDQVTDRIPEWKLQAAIAADLARRVYQGAPFTYAAALEGVIGNLNPYQSQLAVAQGMQKGEPDLRLYFKHGLVMVELKGEKGKLTQSQKDRIPMLRGLGFIVHIVHAIDCEDAVDKVARIVLREITAPGRSRDFPSATWWPRQR